MGAGEWTRLSGQPLDQDEEAFAQAVEQGLWYGPGNTGSAQRTKPIVHADFLAELLLGQIHGLTADPRGVRLRNCSVAGSLDLSRAAMHSEQVDRAVLPLECDQVKFDNSIIIDYASTGAIALKECRLPGFRARGADIATDLMLDACVFIAGDADEGLAHATIDLDGATIGGDFSAKYLFGDPDESNKADAAKVQGDGFGPVPFAQILVDADNSKISGGVDLSCVSRGADRPPETAAVLMGNFDNADIFGDFRAIGARFAPTAEEASAQHPSPRDRRRKALDLRGAQVRGDVELDYIQTAGEVHLEDAILTQDLSLGGARLVHIDPKTGLAGVVLEAMGLSVGGSVHFVDRRRAYATVSADGQTSDAATGSHGTGRAASEKTERDVRLLAIGQIRLTRAHIGGDLDASGATICAVGRIVEGVALDMRSAELAGTLYLDGRRDVGPGLFIGLVNLNHIKVSGSVIFSGSWFRAPSGQQMGPQRIHLQVLSEADDEEKPSDDVDEEWSAVDCSHVARTDRELADWKSNQLWRTCFSAAQSENNTLLAERAAKLADRENPVGRPQPTGKMRALLEALGILPALELSRRSLWRLRGGCRAIAMVDAQVTGSVLFGIGPVAWGKDRRDRHASDQGRDGPSVAIGCVDLDRIRIDGDLRLTGGVFRAVTPLIPTATATGAPDREDDSRQGPPDVSMSYPSTPGWTELKARVCLSLRSARLNGRLDTKYFGPIPLYGGKNQQSQTEPLLHLFKNTSRAFGCDGGIESTQIFSVLEKCRQDLHIVPEYLALDRYLSVAAGKQKAEPAPNPNIAVNLPARFVDEMVCLLDLAATAEAIDDQSLGAALPPLPTVHNLAGWYSLRPDGLFDLSGAVIASIHDHPCHGWPTSDGHLELNGCTYSYITLNHDPSYLIAPRPPAVAEEARNGNGLFTRRARLRPDGPSERRGTSVGRRFASWCLWRVEIAWRLICYMQIAARYRLCRLSCYLGLRPRRNPSCATALPRYAIERHRLSSVRYIEYAVASFRIRHDDQASPEHRRIKWLEQQYPGAGPRKQDFRPQPYEQLARVMRATGFSLDADGIAAAKRNMRWRAGVFGIVQRLFDIGLWVTCKYTYSPTRIFGFLMALLLVGVLISGTAYERGMLVPDRAGAEFSPWIYATDLIVPIVEFGYVDGWRVTEPDVSCFCSETGWHVVCAQADICVPGASDVQGRNWVGRVMGATGRQIMDMLSITGARALEWALGMITGFGALFTALAVITFTGVMRRD